MIEDKFPEYIQMMIILKLIFYDLANVNTNLKVFLFIVLGAAIMYVSYNANKKKK